MWTPLVDGGGKYSSSSSRCLLLRLTDRLRCWGSSSKDPSSSTAPLTYPTPLNIGTPAAPPPGKKPRPLLLVPTPTKTLSSCQLSSTLSWICISSGGEEEAAAAAKALRNSSSSVSRLLDLLDTDVERCRGDWRGRDCDCEDAGALKAVRDEDALVVGGEVRDTLLASFFCRVWILRNSDACKALSGDENVRDRGSSSSSESDVLRGIE